VLYLYAYTNHKENLDSLRRIKVLYDALSTSSIEAEILLNEYRAQLLARDWGLPLATTIETIKDIDAVATINDIVLIDSPEALEGKVLAYGEYFKKLLYINPTCEYRDIKDAKNINLWKDGVIYPTIQEKNLEEKSIFIYGDSDYDKIILKNLDIFKDKDIDLYWGNYFFVKYEEQLEKVFNEIIEAEEYYEIFKKYKNIITSSVQIAIEAKANGLESTYLELSPLDECKRELLMQSDITITQRNINNINTSKKVKNIFNNISSEMVKIIKSYV